MNKTQKIISLCSLAFMLTGFTIWKRGAAHKPDLTAIKDSTNIIPVLIVGSGPTGLSAALFTARAGFKTVVLAGSQPGGHLNEISTIENWPGSPKMKGIELGQELEKQATQFGAHIIKDNAKEIDLGQWPFKIETTDGRILHALTVIAATGGEPKRLDIPGMDTYWGKGVGVCTICDAPLNKGQTVIVVGGSDTAAERAMQLAPFAKKVIMVVREPQLQATAQVQKYLKEYDNISTMLNSQIMRIDGDGNRINTVTVKHNTTNQTEAIPAHAVYLSVGFTPRTDLFKKQVKLDANGYIAINRPTHQTSVPGVFAAGIVTDGVYNKASVSSGMGVQAAIDAINFLQEIGYTPAFEEQIEQQLFKENNTNSTNNLQIIRTQQELDTLLNKPLVVIQTMHPLCSLCQATHKTFKKLAQQYKDKIAFAQLDISKTAHLAKQLGATQASTLIVLKSGKTITTKQTFDGKQIEEFVNNLIR